MGATAGVTLSATVSGLPEGGLELLSVSLCNTSAAFQARITELATSLTAPTTFVTPSSAQMFLAMAYATNQYPWRVTVSSAEAGIPVSSNGVFFCRSAGNTTYLLYTTAGTTFQIRTWTF